LWKWQSSIANVKRPTDELQQLFFQSDCKQSRSYQQHIRTYNMMFAFQSPGAKIDNKYNNGRGPPNLRVQGQSCHRIGSLLPPIGKQSKFAQLYIYDTDNEIHSRIQSLR